jgi:hypothetical protein
VDFLALLALWGPCPDPCIGDLDGDGEVGVTDSLILLANWGQKGEARTRRAPAREAAGSAAVVVYSQCLKTKETLMYGLSMRLDRGFRRHVVRKSVMVALAAGLMVSAAGCEETGEAGAPIAAPVADRSGADAAAAGVDTGGSQTPPVVSAPRSALNIVFDPPALDFGIIPPNVDRTGIIAVRNLGTDPVRIAEVKPTCKCTTLSNLVGEVIEPGGAVELTTELKGRAIAGWRRASVRFIFDGYEDVLSVQVLAEVVRPVRVSPAIFNLVDGTTSGHVVVASLDGRPFNILGANRKPPQYVEFDPDIDEPLSRETHT